MTMRSLSKKIADAPEPLYYIPSARQRLQSSVLLCLNHGHRPRAFLGDGYDSSLMHTEVQVLDWQPSTKVVTGIRMRRRLLDVDKPHKGAPFAFSVERIEKLACVHGCAQYQ
jgi:hypothetical protein